MSGTQYEAADLKLLYLTRRLAALEIDKDRLDQSFGLEALNDYSEKIELMIDEGLLIENDRSLSLAPRGMFYADSVAAFLAETRWSDRGDALHLDTYNNNGKAHM